MFKRTCPNCKKEIVYKSRSAWTFANYKNSMCKSCTCKLNSNPLGNLSILLNNSPESYYWIGFLLADGSISSNYRLRFVLSSKDKEQVLKFGNYIQFNGKYIETNNYYGISIMDTDNCKKLCNTFNIVHNKTYNPPTLKIENNDLYLSLLIGLIDGDGNISFQYKRKDTFLRIKMHKSWYILLQQFNSILLDNVGTCEINKQGYACLTLSTFSKQQFLKRVAERLNLPILKRKWDKISLAYIDKYTKAHILREKVISYYLQNKKNKEISQLCSTSPANVTKIIEQYKNATN